MKLHIIFEEVMGSNLYYESCGFGVCSWQQSFPDLDSKAPDMEFYGNHCLEASRPKASQNGMNCRPIIRYVIWCSNLSGGLTRFSAGRFANRYWGTRWFLKSICRLGVRCYPGGRLPKSVRFPRSGSHRPLRVPCPRFQSGSNSRLLRAVFLSDARCRSQILGKATSNVPAFPWVTALRQGRVLPHELLAQEVVAEFIDVVWLFRGLLVQSWSNYTPW